MLEKNYNIYVIDDVFDDNFACNFKVQSVEEKYAGMDNIDYIKYVLFESVSGNTGKCFHIKNSFFDKDSKIDVEKYESDYLSMQYWPSYDTIDDYYEEIENEYEVGYDEEYIYHDRDIDLGYEDDCEYGGDEEVYGYEE